MNYLLLIAGVAVLGLGFILMVGGGSDDPNVFSEDLFDAQRITIAPLLQLIGFGIVLFAIMKRFKEEKKD